MDGSSCVYLPDVQNGSEETVILGAGDEITRRFFAAATCLTTSGSGEERVNPFNTRTHFHILVTIW
ncbi:hypothetical protein E2C01_053530 [Portunus trituberculatus]|uniref:Uncharacterized protein n=1 Tax=Portunus trituberculatus TaxID=210409 RepID=A0A5B7GR13_PORTR|nr:hypothetical protein [Portunus trituberculatus]